MIFEDLTPILDAGDDTQALYALWHPKERTQNTKMYFKAPLMVSAHQLKHLNKINELATDAVVINLEDGVAPHLKPLALAYAALFVSHVQQSDKKIIVRINPLDEGGIEEIALLNRVRPDAIRIPKIKTPQEVAHACSLIDPSIEVHLSIETAQAWRHLDTLRVDPRVTTYYLGVLDLCAELALAHRIIDPQNPTLHYLLAHFLVTAKSVGVHPVSFVFQEHENSAQLARFIALENEMGFGAKGVISPKQAKQVMEGFTSEWEKAQEIVALFQAQAQTGCTGFVHETYGFIDEPIYKGALALLKQV